MTLPRRALLVAAAAAGIPAATGYVGRPQPATSPQPIDPPRDATYAYTHQRPGGNRVVSGGGAVVDATPVEFAVAGTPAWLLASGRERATDWTVVTDRGAATTHRIEAGSGTAERVADHGTVPLPPLGYRAGGTPRVVVPPPDAAAHTHPVVAGDAVAYVAADGDVVIRQNETTTRAGVAAPPDARPVALGDGRYVVYGGWTDRYRHGALGDTVEGSSLVVVDPPAGRIAVAATLDPPAVFEGLYPLVADLDDDGRPEVVTTVATATGGARIRVYTPDGRERATGPAYGPGWRHQLCAAPFGPDDTTELAVVRKPHVDRTLEYYRLGAGDLTIRATREGYATHTYGSRNVDGGLGGDFDGDGRTELLVPTTDRTALSLVRRVADRAEPVGALPLGARLTTNLVGVRAAGQVAVGAGTADGVRVWAARTR